MDPQGRFSSCLKSRERLLGSSSGKSRGSAFRVSTESSYAVYGHIPTDFAASIGLALTKSKQNP